MNEHDIAAPLAAALAAKGYASLTSVQEAALAPEARGRDVLVSAQTGSGKTVAFGLAMAGDILDGETLPEAGQPLALAIAPTRELALQVARELGWLYEQAGARIATCVGGMDYRTERRALERGAHIVVGTPGRLRDHIERGSLDLTALRACVLDEADEMLDLGFREDLEFILGSAPAERRTLLFSATVPPAIEALARDFQRDALRIQAMGEARQHGDIEYRAMSVTTRDREHAIFNTLRYYEASRAIIFCKTRANVNHLLARMGNRGFKVVALSGELSQQERSHALQALRDGRARVCIATDVAARGIDLPGLELVIHADLPTNPDTLLHRSGRTGRAGAKGTSVLIVPSSEYKRAQRLLQRAKLVAEWGKAPSADEVQARDDARMLDHPALAEAPGDEAGLAAALLDRFGAERVASAFVRLWREGRPAPEELSESAAPAPSAPRERGEFGPAVWFLLSVGHSGRAEARWLLPKICEAGGITRDAIGAIRVKTDQTFVQIAAPVAPNFGERIELEPGLTMRRIEGEPVFDAAPVREKKPHRGPAPVAARPEPLEPRTKPKPKPARRPALLDPDEVKPRPAPEAAADRVPEPEAAPRKARWSAEKKLAQKAAPKAGPRAAGFKSHGAAPRDDRPARGEGAEARPKRAAGFKSHKPAGGWQGKAGDKPFRSGAKPGKPGKR
ncbi:MULTISPECIES: DEAD/DEAH box helicase [Paracoccus]|nr:MULTISPECIES: DEAD/DEAH box helicase [Paracoccus]MBB4628562.1 ATP-dependent RNA helicase DeaD [Paracoccus denitrificans]MCU7430545.1 DEAD/DEAH box helicase [Paracoccus denitrificans]QAR28984.1 DEAD/DEAH box helicase [Paracoccus denitrificans]UFS66828.1 DEAD/DEAH box helicase [Paracoccus denitrificans]UPV97140.1 DEAD/DEAH box helicase [Paracoccus denitrificans]